MILACYPLLLRLIKLLPPEEYTQAVRAPAWLVVAVGSGLTAVAVFILAHWTPGTQPFFISMTPAHPQFMADAYTSWGIALLGAGVAVAAWVPAARRSLVPFAIPPFLVTLLLLWLAVLMLCALHIEMVWGCWVVGLMGAAGLWGYLVRPRLQWRTLEPVLVLALAILLGTIGLFWLHTLIGNDTLDTAWHDILAASPQAVSGALVLVLLGLVGPAFYLPWILWTQREEAAVAWLPAGLLTALIGPLTFVRLIFFAFPARSTVLLQLMDNTPWLFMARMQGWLLAWGMLALLLSAGWLAWRALHRAEDGESLQALVLLPPGLLLLGLAGGLAAPQGSGIVGLLWCQLTWAGSATIWFAGNGLLPALAARERGERTVVLLALLLALAALVAVPGTTGFRGLALLWSTLLQAQVPGLLLIASLLVTAGSVAVLLPRWFAGLTAPAPHPGAGWGIIGPFLVAIVLTLCGLFAWRLDPLLEAIRASLLQLY